MYGNTDESELEEMAFNRTATARAAPSLAKRARLDGSAGCPSQRFPEPGSTTSGSSRPSIDK